MDLTNTEIIIRLITTMFLSGLIGLEREIHGRAAGLRTHILVGIGSSLIMLTSIYIFQAYEGIASVDPSRIAAQVVSGIGFLGAGTILRSKAQVMGLTTAASLWAVAGIGLAAGCGFYVGALVTSILVLMSLFLFTSVERHIIKTKGGD